jgi:hypothetical protein
MISIQVAAKGLVPNKGDFEYESSMIVIQAFPWLKVMQI